MTTTVSSAPESAPRQAPEPPRPKSGRRGWLRPLLLRLHFYAGLLVGPFILVAALSGALYALTPSIEQVVYDHELHAPVADSSAASTTAEPGQQVPGSLPLTEQVEIAEQYLAGRSEGTGADLSAVRPAPEPGDTTRIMFTEPGLGSSESRAVFIAPATGEVRGDLTVYGSSGSLPLRLWVSHLHADLHLGDVGSLYSELAASWLAIIALAGLGLWIARFRMSRARARKDLIRPGLKRTGYRRLYSVHASLGVWVLLGALFLSATGVTWSEYAGANVGELRSALGWQTPKLNTVVDGPSDAGEDSGVGSDDHAGHDHAGHGSASPQAEASAGEAAAPAGTASFDDILAVARQVNVNTGQVEIQTPAEPGSAWVVQEIKRDYPTEADKVAIDGATLEVVDRTDFAGFPIGAKLTSWGISLHMGTFFGPANQVILFLIAITIATLVVLGYIMWWRRRPPDGTRAVGAPPRRGVLRDAPWWGLLAVAGVGVAIGLFFPLVGYTLAGFVVIDVIAGLIKRRKVKSCRGASVTV